MCPLMTEGACPREARYSWPRMVRYASSLGISDGLPQDIYSHVCVPRVGLPCCQAHISYDGYQPAVSDAREDDLAALQDIELCRPTHPNPKETALFASILATRSLGTSSFFVGRTIMK